MNAISVRCKRSVLAILAVLVFSATMCSAVSAQEKRAGQSSGVDNTKMGRYRALAQNVFADFQKGDLANAAQLARVLEASGGLVLYSISGSTNSSMALSISSNKLGCVFFNAMSPP